MNSFKEKDFWTLIAESLEKGEKIDTTGMSNEEKIAYEDACMLWNLSAKIPKPETDVDIAFTKIQQKISQSAAKSVPLRKKWWESTYTIAASVALLVVVSAVSVYYYFQQKDLSSLRWKESYSTAYAQKQQVMLSDGTRVTLNAGSTLHIDEAFGEKGRFVYLEGEAYFEVFRNPSLPFIIQTSHSRVEVLGTSFNLKAYPIESDIELNVVEGKVKFSSFSGESVVLTKGKGAILEKATQQISEYIASESVSWLSDVISFKDETLANVAAYLSRWYDVTITVEESIRHKRLTGQFQDKTIQEVLDYIKIALDIEYTHTQGSFHLQAKKK